MMQRSQPDNLLSAADQAAGLRRLLARERLLTASIVAGAAGDGAGTVCDNLAAALARQGRQVLVLGREPGSAVHPAAQAGGAVAGVSYAGGQGYLARLAHEDLRRLERELAALQPDLDVALLQIDTAAALDVAATMAMAAADAVVVISCRPESITRAYSLIKRMAWEHARRRFQIVVNRARSAEQAASVFGNLSRTARRFLDVALDCLAIVPEDDAVARAQRLGRPVVEAFASAPAAQALRGAAERMLEASDRAGERVEQFVARLVRAGRAARHAQLDAR